MTAGRGTGRRRPSREPAAPFYGRAGLNSETYDARLEPAGTPIEGDVAFYLEQARRHGDPVLEIGSGTGRIAWALGAAGFAVVGLELAPAMLRLARAKASGRPDDVRGRVRFHRGDVRRFDLHRRFPLVLVPFRGFQMLLTPADQRSALTALRRHLEPDGRLILDLFDPRLDWCHSAATPEDTRARERAAIRAAAVLERQSVTNPVTGGPVDVRVVASDPDPLAQILTQRWRFTERARDGRTLRVEEEILRLRWTYRQEMRWLLELEGLSVEREMSDFHGSPPAYGREQVWIVRPAPADRRRSRRGSFAGEP